jgi:hypothetical protein
MRPTRWKVLRIVPGRATGGIKSGCRRERKLLSASTTTRPASLTRKPSPQPRQARKPPLSAHNATVSINHPDQLVIDLQRTLAGRAGLCVLKIRAVSEPMDDALGHLSEGFFVGHRLSILAQNCASRLPAAYLTHGSAKVISAKSLKRLADPARFELTTSAFGGQRSIQLSYGSATSRTLRQGAALAQGAGTYPAMVTPG